MKTNTLPQPNVPQTNVLQRLGNLLTGPTNKAEQTQTASTQTGAVEVEVSSTPDSFIDYAADGDEPADMALLDLVPVELAAFNLPQTQGTTAAMQPLAKAQATTTEPNSSEKTGADTVVSGETIALTNALTPIGLTQLNLQPKQPKTSKSPLPDLSSLARSANQSNHQPNAATVRVPAQHIDQLNTIIKGLLDHQAKQTRHNEQLGALVKQLLGQMAQQQNRSARNGQGSYQDIQQVVKDCLAGSID